MRSLKQMNWKQRIFAVCFLIATSPYLLCSLFVQLVIYNIAVFLYNLDIKVQRLIVKPYDYLLNRLESKQ